MPVRPLLLAAMLAPQAALALPWDGTYRLSEDADCGKVGEEGGALRIGEGVLHGVDATCRMTDPVDVLDLDATLYEMACEGEGQSWTERALLMRAAEGDGIYLGWRGYVFRYDRCPEAEEAPAQAASHSDAPAGSDAGAADVPEAEIPAESGLGAGEAASDEAPDGNGPTENGSTPPEG